MSNRSYENYCVKVRAFFRGVDSFYNRPEQNLSITDKVAQIHARDCFDYSRDYLNSVDDFETDQDWTVENIVELQKFLQDKLDSLDDTKHASWFSCLFDMMKGLGRTKEEEETLKKLKTLIAKADYLLEKTVDLRPQFLRLS